MLLLLLLQMSRFKWRHHNRCGGTLQSLPVKMLHDSCLNDSALSVSRKRCHTQREHFDQLIWIAQRETGAIRARSMTAMTVISLSGCVVDSSKQKGWPGFLSHDATNTTIHRQKQTTRRLNQSWVKHQNENQPLNWVLTVIDWMLIDSY